MKSKVVLAYSGGLDTSFCIPYLKQEKKMEVHTLLVNTGGFSPKEVSALSQKALDLGAASHKSIDIRETYYTRCIRYLIFGNVLKNNTYPLSVSSERAFQAMTVADYARRIGAHAIAHGSTGAGNDQVRFDYFIHVMAPEIQLIAPIRELRISRKEEMDYLKNLGFEFSWEKSRYSINQGIWGTSIGGAETLSSLGELPEEAYPVQCTKTGTEVLTIGFSGGEPISLNGIAMDPLQVIEKIHEIAAPYGIGRDIHVGDTIIGLKGRVGFEAAAPMILIKAHHLLEKHVLGKWQLYWKEQLANWYGMMLHEAQYLDPVMRNIEDFLENTQKRVTGEVSVRLHPRTFTLAGCTSPFDLMNPAFGQYGEGTAAFTGEDVAGFTRIYSLPVKIYQSLVHEHKD
ncbi:MAG TPA: argininosuccinate synthase [Bacteroidales bacterium]|jgi:argininosuccinate synthase|nr:argininosuccinate synthase [Bacteroidales bacterium]MCZ2416209.1 argininosuccinate synthase [Burkholderiales bacterium]OQC58694.1 MAG: Argininosuccinate synthase [Bacteroidetes bacterium ADurb.Bin013]MBP8999041.1 argininosuccinate synthase [Bacteroidales bacterium]MBV6455754.1 Argininosuccinate synthase [Bacteroidales bacterium]